MINDKLGSLYSKGFHLKKLSLILLNWRLLIVAEFCDKLRPILSTDPKLKMNYREFKFFLYKNCYISLILADYLLERSANWYCTDKSPAPGQARGQARGRHGGTGQARGQARGHCPYSSALGRHGGTAPTPRLWGRHGGTAPTALRLPLSASPCFRVSPSPPLPLSPEAPFDFILEMDEWGRW